uniref:ATP synthase complex subunit 8 n=1 Tax=Cerambycidae sp. 7 KM-2017 TaxID=2219292 RepID=A0A346RI16_9CUCU|nr:ATP synthase F0 subunit 8 [Cerambycidae sp. 7 KM-2017]
MPQMAPLNWLILFMFFIMVFLMFNIVNFYSFTIIPEKKKFKKTSISLNWKW